MGGVGWNLQSFSCPTSSYSWGYFVVGFGFWQKFWLKKDVNTIKCLIKKNNVYKKFCSSKILVTKKILIQKYFAHKNVAHKKIAPKNFVQKSSAQKRWPKKCCPKSFINIKSVTAEIFLMEKCRQKSLGLKNCCVQNFFSETNFWANKSRL